jgi:transposase-like protein
MSNTVKKSAVRGVRYNDAQKKEVVDFALSYNAENGRGGQSKAAEKFGISQITVSAWLKAVGAPASAKKIGSKNAAKAPKAPKAPKAAKASKASKAGKARPGSRYTPEEKQEVVDFVTGYNAANGRGGQSKASEKFGVSPLTVMAWLKGAGVGKLSKKGAAKLGRPPGKRGRPPGKASSSLKSAGSNGSGLNAKLSSLLALSNEIAKAEANLASLRSKFSSLKASL